MYASKTYKNYDEEENSIDHNTTRTSNEEEDVDYAAKPATTTTKKSKNKNKNKKESTSPTLTPPSKTVVAPVLAAEAHVSSVAEHAVTVRPADEINTLMQPMDQLNIIDFQNQSKPTVSQQSSVDALLMHNSPSPPKSSLLHLQQNLNFQQPPVLTYRKVRPEPISDKTLVGSVVNFFHDVVSGDVSKHSLHHHSTHPSSSSSSSSVVHPEIKEQIEWLHFEPFHLLFTTSNQTAANKNNTFFNTPFASAKMILVLGYKTGFSIWTIDLNGIATEALSIKEPNITHVKLLQLESANKLLIAICKLITNDDEINNTSNFNATDMPSLSSNSMNSNDITSHSPQSFTSMSPQSSSSMLTSSASQANGSSSSGPIPSSSSHQQQQKKYKISIVNLINGSCLHETIFNGNVIELKSNSNILCVNSWNRIDAFDLNTFEHRFSINTCYSQVSKSTGQIKNPFALGNRWLAFADNKFHSIYSSIGGVSTDIEQSYTATVFNTAKSISKGLVTVVNSVVSKSKATSSSSSSSGNNHSPRLNGGNGNKMRHDSKEDYQAGICTIIDTKKYVNNSRKPTSLHDEYQNWIIAHFLAHQEQIYALEFNNNGRLLVTADILGQYFNVFQINANAFKSTRTVVKHLYSLHRGDTNAKLRNISFSNDSRWLAISTKRGTTHIFPLNSYGGPVNARTHSKPYVVNRTSKHQRTAGFIDQDDLYNQHQSSSLIKNPSLHNNANNLLINNNDMQQYQMQQMLQQQYDNSCSSPIVINNNPKLKSLLEPFVIPAYGQLKQPNANSSFQSSIISSNATSSSSSSTASGLLTAVSSIASQQLNGGSGSNQQSATTTATSLVGLASSNLAASALSSAALVTENVTNFASNTTNMIQYDNVCAVAAFGESRGYLTPDEPRDFNRLKPANSLFVISDVNGNLVEYVLDVVVDASKAAGNKPTNDSPIQLKISPKAQWPLQRLISSDELTYPIQMDNPLMKIGVSRSGSFKKQGSLNFYYNGNDMNSLNSNGSGYSLNSFNSNSPNSFVTAPNSLNPLQQANTSNNSNNDWIRMIDINTHLGPHRRLFMGPQFVFKTFNSNITTTMLNPTSSSVMSDVETPIIDLSDNIELNSLDLSGNNSSMAAVLNNNQNKYSSSTLPMQIASKSSSNFSKSMKYHQKFDCTPTYIDIEVGAGSFQEGMPIMCGHNGNINNFGQCLGVGGSTSSRGSQKSLSSNNGANDLLNENLIESLADAMNETTTTTSSTNHHAHPHSPSIIAPVPLSQNHRISYSKSQAAHNNGASSPSIAINIGSNKLTEPNLLLMNAVNGTNGPILTAPSSCGSNSSGVFTVGSYFMINSNMPSSNANANTSNGPTVNTSITSFTSSSSASSSSSSSRSSTNSNNDDDSLSSNVSSASNCYNNGTKKIEMKTHQKRHNHKHDQHEGIQFQDDSNLLH